MDGVIFSILFFQNFQKNERKTKEGLYEQINSEKSHRRKK